MTFDLSDYIDVAARIVEFRERHPEGSLQQVSVQFVDFAGESWVVYTAAAYRTPDDVRPGHGTAWEPVPGRTPYTKYSEVQNAETAAWGRAIVAVGAADTRRGVASADEVRNRQEETPERSAEHTAALADLDAAIAEAHVGEEAAAKLREFGGVSVEHAVNAAAKVRAAATAGADEAEEVPF